jgi:hypothetical protein
LVLVLARSNLLCLAAAVVSVDLLRNVSGTVYTTIRMTLISRIIYAILLEPRLLRVSNSDLSRNGSARLVVS